MQVAGSASTTETSHLLPHQNIVINTAWRQNSSARQTTTLYQYNDSDSDENIYISI